ncbi:MAG TPA: SCO family protein [Acidiferrobacteraceae bacterium]|nr:SCO family protein [Acidiferrobacteraceae bacterium]HEX19653.1 SCO family protein [Acidiferrobacteraceae bacterium]
MIFVEINVRLLAVISLATLFLSACNQPPEFRSTDISSVSWGKDFELTADNGKRIHLQSFRDRVVILFFGYSSCPDICAPTLYKLSRLNQRLGKLADRVQVIFVTVDPGYDTPKRLREFLHKFDKRFIGLTGNPREISEVQKEYKVAIVAKKASGQHKHQHRRVDHSGFIFIKDGKGRLRLMARETSSVADLEHDIRLLLQPSS